jgi:hypothetical protein
MRHVGENDILISRLKLLVIMAKVYLQDGIIGKHSVRSIIRNTGHLAKFLSNWYHHLNTIEVDKHVQRSIDLDHIFYQRIKLLAIMVKSIAEGTPLAEHRKIALKNNVEYICDILPYLHVAHRPNLSVIK